jgi:hypothetical protein
VDVDRHRRPFSPDRLRETTLVAIQRSAQLQVLLEGVALPASKQELVDYARREDEDAADALAGIPNREYRSLDDVGEALASVQPSWRQPDTGMPREESDLPPGGDDYTRPRPQSGAVRPSAPADNPPQRAIEAQSKKQNQQAENRKRLDSG